MGLGFRIGKRVWVEVRFRIEVGIGVRDEG